MDKETTTTMTPETFVDVLGELHDTVSSTYKDLQVSLQQQAKQEENDSTTAAAAAAATTTTTIDTNMATFNLAMGAALQKINLLTEQHAAALLQDDNAMQALGQLTWLLLRIAPFLGSINQNLLVAQSTGAAAERLGLDARLRSEQHCGFLFHNVVNFLHQRAACLQTSTTSTEALDAILQAFCPPLMVFFGKTNLPLLAQLRAQERTAMDSLAIWRRPIVMIRRLLLQSIEETMLLLWAEKNDEDEDKIKLTFGQRVQFSGLYVNKDLAAWAIEADFSSSCPALKEAGAAVEMAAWTALRDPAEGLYCAADANPHKPHRINHQGVPFDIPAFGDGDGEKIVIFYLGQVQRKMQGKVFPLIDLEANVQGDPLTSDELQALYDRIQAAPTSAVKKALEHQMQRGGPDHLIQETLTRLQMSSLTISRDNGKGEVALN